MSAKSSQKRVSPEDTLDLEATIAPEAPVLEVSALEPEAPALEIVALDSLPVITALPTNLDLVPVADEETPSELEIFYDLARTGQIDPWDVDIVLLTDKFLAALSQMDIADLKKTGKALLVAAVLLRFKSDTLQGLAILPEPTPEYDDGFEDPSYDGEADDLPDNVIPLDPVAVTQQRWHAIQSAPAQLDNVLKPRFSARPTRQRKVTLTELIEEIKRFETLEMKKQVDAAIERREGRKIRSYEKLTTKDIVELAHDEFIEATVIKLQHLLERLLLHQEAVTLTELEESGGLDRVSAYIALLFLTAQGQIDLHQEAFYEELHVMTAEQTSLEAALLEVLDDVVGELSTLPDPSKDDERDPPQVLAATGT